jgi:hypothetical protein
MIRYKEAYRVDAARPSDYRYAEVYYRHALYIGVPTGAIRKKLAAMDKKRSASQLDIVFELLQCLSARRHPYNSREFLLEVLEQQRTHARLLSDVDSLSQISADDHSNRFVSHLLACVCITFSRTGADTFGFHLDRMKRHLSNMLQMRTADAYKNSVLFSRSQEGRSAQSLIDSIDDVKLKSVEDILTASLAIIVSVYQILTDKNNVWAMATLKSANVTAMGGEVGGLVLQKINQMRSVPGLMDSMRLLTGFLSSVVGGTGIGLYASAQDDKGGIRDMFRFRSTITAVSIFFDFLSENPVNGFIAILNNQEWEQLEIGLRGYFNVLQFAMTSVSAASASLDSDALLTVTPDDLALRGCSAVFESIEERTSRDIDPTKLFSVVSGDDDVDSRTLFDYCRAKCAETAVPSLQLQIKHLRCKTRARRLSTELLQLPISGQLSANSSVTSEAVLFDINMVPHFAPDKLTAEFSRFRKLLSCDATSSAEVRTSQVLRPAVKTTLNLPGFGSYRAGSDEKPRAEGDDRDDNEEGSESSDSSVDETAAGQEDDDPLSSKPLPQMPLAGITSDSASSEAGLLRLGGAVIDTLRAASSQSAGGDGASSKADKLAAKRHRSNEKRKQSQELYSDMFSKKLPSGPRGSASAKAGSVSELPLIVLDAPNIAMRHGLNERFSSRGIAIVFNYFLSMGHKVIGFLPVSVLRLNKITT